MAAEAGEVFCDIVPGLEGIRAKLDEGAHGFGLFGIDEVVAVEKLLLVGEDGVTIGWDSDVVVKPGVDISIVLRLDWGRGYEVELVGLEQGADGLLGRTVGLLVLIGEGVDVDIDDRTLATFLMIVDPTDDGNHSMHEGVVVHAMFAMKADGGKVVGMKEVVGVDRCVFIAEEPPYARPFLIIIKTLEAMIGHFLVFLDNGLGDDELLDAVETGIGEMLVADHAVFLHRVAHPEGRIDEDTVKSVEHLGIHAAHGGADDEVGLFLLAELPEERHRLFRTDGKVGGDDGGIGHHLTDSGDCARLAAAAKAVDIHDLLPLKDVGELLDIGVL